MGERQKKSIGVLLTVAVLTSGLFFSPRRAEALSVSDFDPTTLVAKISCKAYGFAKDRVVGPLVRELFGNEIEAGKKLVEKGAVKAGSAVAGLFGLNDEAEKERVGEGADSAVSARKGILEKIPGADDIAVPVRNKDLEKTVQVEGAATRGTAEKISCEDKVRKSVAGTLKKRLLDILVNRTLEWIQGNGQPKFADNFEGVFEDALQASVGDVAQEIGLGRLCSPYQMRRLQLMVQAPSPFVHAISCTFDDIKVNFENFARDFLAGGWIGYQEVLKPQNNRWGQELLVQDQLLRKRSEKEQALFSELQAGGGFFGEKICRAWRQDETGLTNAATASWEEDDYNIRSERRKKDGWRCIDTQTITPGSIIGEAVYKTVKADFDFIIDAEGLSQYAAMFGDAVINRLFKEGTTGLRGLFTGLGGPGGTGGSPRRGDTRRREDFSDFPEAAEALSDYNQRFIRDFAEESTKAFEDKHRDALNILSEVRNFLIKAGENGEKLKLALTNLAGCYNDAEIHTGGAFVPAQLNVEDDLKEVTDLLSRYNSESPGLLKKIDDIEKELEQVDIFRDAKQLDALALEVLKVEDENNEWAVYSIFWARRLSVTEGNLNACKALNLPPVP